MRVEVRGLGFIELLVSLAVLAILASLAVSHLQQGAHAAASETVITDLARMIATGRAAAVTHGGTVSLCSLQTDAEPVPKCRPGVWMDPLTLFTDHNGDAILNGNDSVLSQQLLSAVPGMLRFRSFPAGRTALQFTALGSTNNQTGNFLWCANTQDASTAHQLIFNNIGRTRFAQDSNGDGIRENASGTNLSCH